MKKTLLFVMTIMVIAATIVSCKDKKGPEPQQSDVRDAFVGEYTLVLNGTISATTGNSSIDAILPEALPINNFEDVLVISKDESSANKVNITGLRGLYNCSASVSGNELFLESSVNKTEFDLGETSGVEQLKGITIPINYTLVHKSAKLTDNVLEWHTDGTGSGSFELPIVGSLTISGSASIDNTATKR
ncbi:MAG: hypothetical protein MJZ93_02135 [Paludibacteraceae bacterium]|nr:hypothetical protein [Paludibacteraceae bacterium]